MRWALLTLCACNRLFDLGDVQERHIDARLFDMPLDAAATCATGVAPQFRNGLHQIQMAEQCRYLTVAETGDVMAMCNSTPRYGTLAAGLTPLVLDIDPGFYIQDLRIAPEGDFALAYVTDSQTGNPSVQALRRNTPATTWRVEGATNLMPLYSTQLSNVSRLVVGQRQLLLYDTIDGMFHVYRGDAETWTPTGIVFPTGLQTAMPPAALTPDALHFVMRGIGSNGLDLGTFYYERVDVSQPFGPPHYVATVPHDAQDPFMTNDCGRIYFDALDTVLYVDQ